VGPLARNTEGAELRPNGLQGTCTPGKSAKVIHITLQSACVCD